MKQVGLFATNDSVSARLPEIDASFDSFEVRAIPDDGGAATKTEARRPRPTETSVEAVMPLPKGFDDAFEIPTADKDQYGNPVVTRNGSKLDPETGLPFELWLREPTMEFVLIPSGEFMMGSGMIPGDVADKYGNTKTTLYEREHPQHSVEITRSFYFAKYEVTQAHWQAVMETQPWSGQHWVREHPRHPAVQISWEDCQEFASRLNHMVGRAGFRLPTEAEWEYACRAGSTSEFCFGDDPTKLREYAWYEDNAENVGERYAHPVGLKRANAWGLYDMHGNVWKWCQDWYGAYPNRPGIDPTGPQSGTMRVYRGGSLFQGAVCCRSALRLRNSPRHRMANLGFRPVMSLP